MHATNESVLAVVNGTDCEDLPVGSGPLWGFRPAVLVALEANTPVPAASIRSNTAAIRLGRNFTPLTAHLTSGSSGSSGVLALCNSTSLAFLRARSFP